MKKIVLYAFIVSLVSFFSCTNEDYIKYDSTQKDAVYINNTPSTDSIFYNFGFESIRDTVLNVEVRLMGVPRDYDRKFNVKTVNDKYASSSFIAAKKEYYDVPETVILPKGAVEVKIPVKLIRNAELETSRAILTLEIGATDDLEIRGHNEYTITFDDMMPKAPAWWQYSTYMYGGFTKEKYKLFLKFFWDTEETEPYFYNKLVTKFGRELNQRTSPFDNPSNDFPIFVKTNIWWPLYNYQEANPGTITGVVKPS